MPLPLKLPGNWFRSGSALSLLMCWVAGRLECFFVRKREADGYLNRNPPTSTASFSASASSVENQGAQDVVPVDRKSECFYLSCRSHQYPREHLQQWPIVA